MSSQLSMQVGTTESEVRDYIGKLRGNMRAAVMRLQRKATSGSPAGAPPRAQAHHSTPGARPGAMQAPPQQQTASGASIQPHSGTAPTPRLPFPVVEGSMGLPSSAASPKQQVGASLAQPAMQQQAGNLTRMLLAGAAAQGPKLEAIAVGQPSQQAGIAGQSHPPAAAMGLLPPPQYSNQPQQHPVDAQQHADALPSSLQPATQCKQQLSALDVNGLQEVLKSAGISQGAQAARPEAIKASSGAAQMYSQLQQPSQINASHRSVQPNSMAAPSAAAASPAPVTPTQNKAAAGLGPASLCAVAAVLAAVDEDCARDAAALNSLLDARRSIRPDCAGSHPIVLS